MNEPRPAGNARYKYPERVQSALHRIRRSESLELVHSTSTTMKFTCFAISALLASTALAAGIKRQVTVDPSAVITCLKDNIADGPLEAAAITCALEILSGISTTSLTDCLSGILPDLSPTEIQTLASEVTTCLGAA
ncbi:hypothetical protein SISSUDRAFT_172946 [Sistotremastrum suecicum HHB10207 ss-3]|uniref:Uncharacterized protein n=1 Tax=Sistotremastrum suecicum HHB10207 ss-3 TaxID=1314776 RepID=A0A166AJS7_9AGAM|nr:hypothetical protein SISSUDRAFT_172946 [Sistotremastrum suecicum HHB10207 ss-3]